MGVKRKVTLPCSFLSFSLFSPAGRSQQVDSDFSLSSCGLRLIGQIFNLSFIGLLPDSSCRAILRLPTPSLPSLILPNPAGHYLLACEHPTRNRSRKPGPDPTAPYLSSPFKIPLILLTWSTFPNPLYLCTLCQASIISSFPAQGLAQP